MHEALIEIARVIAAAHHRWRCRLGRRPLFGEVSRLEERLHRIEAESDLLRRRLWRVPARRRPYYRPWERLEILWHRTRYRLSIDATARAFALTRSTILNWERALERKQLRTVRAKDALQGFPELIAELTSRLKLEWPDWGTRRIAGLLAQMGVQTSRTTVPRVLRRRPRRPAPEDRPTQPPLTAKDPSHVWLADFTRLSNGFRTVWVGAVIDAFSRRILALVVAPKGPDARTTLRMLRHARKRHGVPSWFVSDQGTEVTAGRWVAGRDGIEFGDATVPSDGRARSPWWSGSGAR